MRSKFDNKKGSMELLGIIALIALVSGGLIFGGVKFGLIGGGDKFQVSDDDMEGTAADDQARREQPQTQQVTADGNVIVQVQQDECQGLSAGRFTFNDLNEYQLALDPATTLLYYEGYQVGTKSADDASITNAVINEQIKGIAGNGSSTYFPKLVEFKAGCKDSTVSPKLCQATTATTTVFDENDNTNSDSADVALNANDQHTFRIKVKAPKYYCTQEYGSVAVCHYDATYVQRIEPDESTGVTSFAVPSWITDYDANKDSKIGFLLPGKVANGDSKEYKLDVFTTTSTPGEDNATIICSRLPMVYTAHPYTFQPLLGVSGFHNDNISIVADNFAMYSS